MPSVKSNCRFHAPRDAMRAWPAAAHACCLHCYSSLQCCDTRACGKHTVLHASAGSTPSACNTARKTDECGGLVGNHNQRIPAAQTVRHSAKKTKAATDLGVRDRGIGMQAVAVTHQSKEKHRTCRAPKSNQCYTYSYEAQKAHAHRDSSPPARPPPPPPPPPDKPTNDRERRPDSIYDSKTRPRCPARKLQV
jgi:hypothetical protein